MESPSQSNPNSCIMQIIKQLFLKQADENGSNILFSPLSFHCMLNLIAAGAAGQTLEQLLLFTGSKNMDDLNFMSSIMVAVASVGDGEVLEENHSGNSPRLSFANSIWVDKCFPLKPSFQQIANMLFKAEAKEVNFAIKADDARIEINSWIKKATKDLIDELIPSDSISNDTALVLANALYFKGSWDRKFEPSKTQVKSFHLLNGQTVQVPFITSRRHEKHLYRSSKDGFKVLKIPYQNHSLDARQFAMYFFLPDKRNGLNLIIDNCPYRDFLNQDFNFREEMLQDKLWIPRFKFSCSFEASEILKNLGLNLPFMDAAQFTEMIDCPQSLCISKIFHKCCVEVNEEGTEAAASTAPRIIRKSNRLYKPSFIADHPFMFIIREETSNVVLFTGAVLNPLLGA